MTARRSMTLNLSADEMGLLDELSEKKDVSKTTLIRQALRLYQLVDARIERGDRLFFENAKSKEKLEFFIL